MNVSSIVVKTRPEDVSSVLDSLNSSDLCDVHFHDEKGRIIITVEGENVEAEMLKMKQIQNMPRVLMAELIYSYSEDELAQAKELFGNRKDAVPDVLKEDGPEAESIMGYFKKIKKSV